MKVNVQFTDATQTAIKIIFGGPQNPSDYANLGTVDDTDPRYLAVANPASTLLGAKNGQTSSLYTSCDDTITANFAANGRTYPATPIDQQNMTQTAANAAGGSLMCMTGGTWGLVAHTQADAQSALAAFIAVRDAARAKLQTLIAQVNAAATVDAVRLIVW